MKAQIQALEEEVVKYKTDIDKLRSENSDLSNSLSEEQRKAINLAAELSNNSRYIKRRFNAFNRGSGEECCKILSLFSLLFKL